GIEDFLQVLALFNGRLDGDFQLVRNHRHDRIDASDRQAQRAADIANRRLGRHRAEGADLRHAFLAVFVLDVLDYFATALLAEVDINIRSLAAAFVEEAFEEEIVLQRADVAQVKPVGHERANARSAGGGRNVLLPRESYK